MENRGIKVEVLIEVSPRELDPITLESLKTSLLPEVKPGIREVKGEIQVVNEGLRILIEGKDLTAVRATLNFLLRSLYALLSLREAVG